MAPHDQMDTRGDTAKIVGAQSNVNGGVVGAIIASIIIAVALGFLFWHRYKMGSWMRKKNKNDDTIEMYDNMKQAQQGMNTV
jgi:hypothetical protein